MPAIKILPGESMAKSFPKINQAIVDSYEAKEKSSKADGNSNLALRKATNVQTQLNTIVVEGDSSPAADQARVGVDNKVYGSLKDRLDGEYTQLTGTVQQSIEETRDFVINVRTSPYNAKGDGVTDDTPAFQKAVNEIKAKGGGTLYIPDTGKEYFIRGAVQLCDNLKITSNGATLSKKNAPDYYVFLGLSGTNRGYGSGPSNLVFEGFKMKGSLQDNRGASITLHHSKNVTFNNCDFSECVVSGHPIDLGGCSDVIIRNCYFYGQKLTAGREYVEAIQIDHSTAEGNGGVDGAYDGLPCVNVTVEYCKFLPLTVNGIRYPAPNPFGSHSRVEGQIFTNIKFLNNYVEDGIPTPDGVPYAAGWLHFYHVDGLEISGNEFINTDGRNARILGLYSIDSAILLGDIHLLNPTKKAYTPVPAKNVIIRGNKIKGFSHETNGRTIYLQGRQVGSTLHRLSNIRITDNDFENCYNDSGGARNISSDLIYADMVNGLVVSSNNCDKVKRLLYGEYVNKLKFTDNILNRAYWTPLNLAECTDATAFNNTVENFGGGFYFRAVRKLNVSNNTFSTGYSEAAASYLNIIAVNDCSRFSVKDNDFSDSSNSPYKSIGVYGASSTGFVRDNIVTGVSTGTVSADSSGVVVS